MYYMSLPGNAVKRGLGLFSGIANQNGGSHVSLQHSAVRDFLSGANRRKSCSRNCLMTFQKKKRSSPPPLYATSGY